MCLLMPVAYYRPQGAFNLSVNFEAKVPTITASLKTIVYAIFDDDLMTSTKV